MTSLDAESRQLLDDQIADVTEHHANRLLLTYIKALTEGDALPEEAAERFARMCGGDVGRVVRAGKALEASFRRFITFTAARAAAQIKQGEKNGSHRPQ